MEKEVNPEILARIDQIEQKIEFLKREKDNYKEKLKDVICRGANLAVESLKLRLENGLIPDDEIAEVKALIAMNEFAEALHNTNNPS